MFDQSSAVFQLILFINGMFKKRSSPPSLGILVCGMAFYVKFLFILTFLS